MKVEEAREIAREKIEQLAAELARGQSDTLKAYLAAMARFPRYSLNNMLLIATQRPDARQIASFGTWRRLGRYVRKGEHGIAILAPIVKHGKRNGVPGSRIRELPAKCEDGEPREVVMGFRGAYVFDVSQTEGAPVPEFASVAGDPSVFTDRLRCHIADQGLDLSYSERIAPAQGISTGTQIVLRRIAAHPGSRLAELLPGAIPPT
jgi:hypothetical protein